MEREAAARSAIQRFLDGKASFAKFVAEFELVIDQAEGARDARAANLRRLWGQLEILNALNEGADIACSQRGEVADILREIDSILLTETRF